MLARLLLFFLLIAAATPSLSLAEPMSHEAAAARVPPPYALGQAVNDKGVWELLNSGGGVAGYAFETGTLAPLPGFSGGPIDLFAMLDREGRFLDVSLVSQNEPVFVSGLGEAPLNAFLEQYRGLSINSPITIARKPAINDGGQYIDGVAKATASVRIAHESILAAALEVAREKMKGVSARQPARPDPSVKVALDWADLVNQGLVKRLLVSSDAMNRAFAGSEWADDDDAVANPDAADAIDLWVADIGPLSIAKALLSPESAAELARFVELAPDTEPILVIQAGRLPLTGKDFIRNTTPDLMEIRQNGLPVEVRDADIIVERKAGVPKGEAMILRVDRRLGFDPLTPWTMRLFAERRHGVFQPELGRRPFDLAYEGKAEFFIRPSAGVAARPAWLEAIDGRKFDLAGLALFIAVLMPVLYLWQERLAAHPKFTLLRNGVLAARLVGAGAVVDRDGARQHQGARRFGQLRLPALRSVLPPRLARRHHRLSRLGAWLLLRLALPLWRAAGFHGEPWQAAPPSEV